MRRTLVSSLFLLAWAGAPFAGKAQAQETIHWLDNYQEALRQARETRKPVFLEFRCEA